MQYQKKGMDSEGDPRQQVDYIVKPILKKEAYINLQKIYGRRVLLTCDPFEDLKFKPCKGVFDIAKRYGFQTEIYFIGPGSDLSKAFTKGQCQRMKNAAILSGIKAVSSCKPSASWVQEYQSGGWWKLAKKLIDLANERNVTSIEIDNLSNNKMPPKFKGWGDIEFYKEYDIFAYELEKKRGLRTRIVVHDIDEKAVALLNSAIRHGRLRRSSLADFGLYHLRYPHAIRPLAEKWAMEVKIRLLPMFDDPRRLTGDFDTGQAKPRPPKNTPELRLPSSVPRSSTLKRKPINGGPRS